MDRTEAFHGGAHTSCAHVRGQGNATELPHSYSLLSAPLRSPAITIIHIHATSLIAISPQQQCKPHSTPCSSHHAPSTTTNSTFTAQSNNNATTATADNAAKSTADNQFKTPKARGCRLVPSSEAAVCSRLEAVWPKGLRTIGGELSHTGPAAQDEPTPEASRKGRELAGALPEIGSVCDGGISVATTQCGGDDSAQKARPG